LRRKASGHTEFSQSIGDMLLAPPSDFLTFPHIFLVKKRWNGKSDRREEKII